MAKRKKQRRQFSAEYKAEVVELIRTSGRSIGEIARELDISDSVVRNWVHNAEPTTGKKNMTTNEDLQRELWDARKRIKELEMERSILFDLTSGLELLGEAHMDRKLLSDYCGYSFQLRAASE